MASDAEGTAQVGLGPDAAEWNLRELDLDAAGEALIGGGTDIIASDEWQARFGENASRVAALLERHLRDRAATLEAEAAEDDTIDAARIARLEEERKRSEREETDRLRELNPAVTPGVYRATVRVTARGEKSLGVPGVLVRLAAAPGSTPLAGAVSDESGNAVLAVPEDRLHNEADAVFMAVPSGEAEERPVILQRRVHTRSSQVDLFRGEVDADQGFESEVDAATRAAESREVQRESLAQRLDQVAAATAERRSELQAEIALFTEFLDDQTARTPHPDVSGSPAPGRVKPVAKRPKKVAGKGAKRKRT